jgi:hypothetical protein
LLQPTLRAFNPNTILVSQNHFDQWHNNFIQMLSKSGLVFGFAQKFVNMLMKDWCAANVIASQNNNYQFLHAPIDNIIATAVARYTRCKHPTLGIGLYANLTPQAYNRIQQDIQNLGIKLGQQFQLNFIPTRLDVEQLIWGWV